MSDFGHEAVTLPGPVHIDAWGAGPFVITAGGKQFRFEDSDRFGPYLVRNNGAIRSNPYPGERSPFWRAHRIWKRQGRRVADDGITCIWDEPKPTKVRHFGGRNYLVVEGGDEDGETIIVD